MRILYLPGRTYADPPWSRESQIEPHFHVWEPANHFHFDAHSRCKKCGLVAKNGNLPEQHEGLTRAMKGRR